jgi:pyruvate formate lyase activating enzyme
MSGRYFSIEEFSVYDGPGIRTTVFLKGCPLRCSWCHNPEGQSHEIEIARSPNGCLDCGACERFAEREGDSIRFTEQSLKSCPRSLLRYSGIDTDAESLCEKLLKNAILLKDGGVTFSGGEPLMQSEFVFECLSLLKGKLNTAIQTSGYCSEQTFLSALELCDYVLYDLKIIDDDAHRYHTGVSNERILKNFSRLAKSGVDFVTRVPLIPSVTDTRENISAIARVLLENGVHYVELLPYNKMAGGKYKMIMREYEPTFDDKREIELHLDIFDKNGIAYKIL